MGRKAKEDIRELLNSIKAYCIRHCSSVGDYCYDEGCPLYAWYGYWKRKSRKVD